MKQRTIVEQYNVYWVNLDPTIGREIKKTRPCIVVSPTLMNNNLDTIIVVPLTSTVIAWPFRTIIKLKSKQSSAACDQLRCISKKRIGKKIGHLTSNEKKRIVTILHDIFAQ